MRFEYLESRRLLDAGARLLYDLENTLASSESVWFHDQLYFVAADDQTGVELWRADTERATRATDIAPGTENAYPQSLHATAKHLFFTAYSPSHGRELWSIDRQTQSVLRLTDLVAGPVGSFDAVDASFASIGDELFFGFEGDVWTTDGTIDNTRRISDIGAKNDKLTSLRTIGEEVFFLLERNGKSRLWRSTGISSGSIELAGADHVIWFSEHEGNVIFADADNAIWRLDVSGETLQLLDPATSRSSLVGQAGGVIFYRRQLPLEASAIDELWATDGTASGTLRLAVAGPGENFNEFTIVGDSLVFTRGNRLIRSSGTVAGTVEISGFANGTPRNLVAADDSLLFHLDIHQGLELWKLDGDQASPVAFAGGTSAASVVASHDEQIWFYPAEGGGFYVANESRDVRRLHADLHGPTQGANVASEPAALESDLFVSVRQNQFDMISLLRLDVGAAKVMNLAPDLFVSENAAPVTVDERVFFVATNDINFNSLWFMDAAGEVHPVFGTDIPPAEVADLTPMGDQLFFTAFNEFGREVWVTDATGNAQIVHDVVVDPFGPRPIGLTEWSGFIYFVVGDQLWRSEGTTSKTEQVGQLKGVFEGDHIELHVAGGSLFVVNSASGQIWRLVDETGAIEVVVPATGTKVTALSAGDSLVYIRDPDKEAEVWVANAHGHHLLRDLSSSDRSPRLLASIGNATLFSVGDTLWSTIGATASAVPIAVIPHLGDTLVSAVDDYLVLGLPGNVIWASDGTIGGTRPLNVTGLPGQASVPFAFRRVGDRLVFFADDGFHGVEPWSVPWSLVNQHIDADLTGDRIVGFADFLILAHNFGLRDATPDQGDLDRDRTVSFTDFLILADQYAS